MRTIPLKVTTINMGTGEEKQSANEAMLVPARPGTCPDCACEHKPSEPHNKHSMFYQVAFKADYGRWPTWADAMAHCSDEWKVWLVGYLNRKGINVNG